MASRHTLILRKKRHFMKSWRRGPCRPLEVLQMLAAVSSRAVAVALVALVGCARAHADPSVGGDASTSAESTDGGAATQTTTSADLDAGKAPEQPPPDGMFVWSTVFIAPIFSA